MSKSPADRPERSEDEPSVSPDGAFEALADPRRRAVVSVLRERPGKRLSVAVLADALAAREASATGRRHIAASLTTTHLPTLDDCGLIEYDETARTVRYVESPLVEGLLQRAKED